MTGYPKLDLAMFVVSLILLAASEALGKSQRFKANGVIQFIASFISAGAKGVLAASPASGITQKLIEKAEPCIEHCIESAIDKPKPYEPQVLPITNRVGPITGISGSAVGEGPNEEITTDRLTAGHR